MKYLARILVCASLLTLVGGATDSPDDPKSFDARVQSDPSTQPARFTWIDAYIDPKGHPLAAYQLELKSTGGGAVTLVGVEGGEHPAFAPPPYYDPKANLNNRIVIAAFNTGENLPTRRTRVARVMVRVTGSPKYAATLEVAASPEEKPIDAQVSVSEGAGQ